MTRLVLLEDCGNSPKNLFVQNLTIALAVGDVNQTLSSVSDDIRYEVIGKRLVQGKDDLAGMLEELHIDPPSQLEIQHVLTHGKAGAVDGELRMKNGDSFRFCNLYEFTGAKGTVVRKILSYVLKQ